MRFRKKPIIIEAIQWKGYSSQAHEIHDFTGGKCYMLADVPGTLYIKTLEGDMIANEGDWIVKGVQGEPYPVKPDIFEATYDPVVD